jgi:hypothetical protein
VQIRCYPQVSGRYPIGHICASRHRSR